MGIHKIEVARGIQWIEIPEANLRILCGCPADAVKHLIKRGLILPKQFKGVASETGPNALLLSDLSVQNGEFANLAEFPILQMLYKQGLILPGHPNNVGNKPLLIGSAEQVDSQLRYIYRGNYGLVSRDEIIEAGVPPEQADEMMRIKLKFAFGSIRPTSDFVDARVLGDNAVAITDDLSLRRLAPNVFEFAYHGETIQVDLNLKPGEVYECAYPLGFRRFEPEYFAVIHTGEGDGWDVNRPCMSSIITYQGRIFLIDAGPNLATSMAALGIGIDQVDGIFHTHAHDDHFAGLTTLMRAGRRISYFATPLVRSSVAKKLAALMGIEEEQFADYFDIRDLTADTWNNVDGLEVMPVYSPHPVETNIYTFRALWGDGYRTYAHFADIVSLDVLREMVTDNSDVPGLDQAAFDRTRKAYLIPVDLKKVDVGGNMIHGSAKDFREDKSTRILLAHRAGDLTAEEKEIGSSAAFGTVDILVAGQSEQLRHHAFSYLATHLPGMPLHELRLLVNHPMTEVNPGAIILKEGETPQDVVLLVSGRVEKIRTRDSIFGSMSAGSFIGVGSIIDNRPSHNTYRASSFLRVIRLPGVVYAEVIRRNGLLELMRRTAKLRAFLDSTPLFSEGLPATALRRIVETVKERQFKPGETIADEDLKSINIVRSGLIERVVGTKVLDVLTAHASFGEEGAIFKVPYLSHLRVREETSVYQIAGEILRHVPLLHWKLFESYQHRVARVIYSDDPGAVFVWRDTFSSQIAEIDLRNQRMIQFANTILANLSGATDQRILTESFVGMVGFAHDYFSTEEKLLALHSYPEARSRIKKNQELIGQLTEYQQQVLHGGIPDRASFQHFFESWMVRHILKNDRKIDEFLSSQGVH
ncbi:MAG: hemerythrin domain-containing protein [Betaproteobacteria bacterium]